MEKTPIYKKPFLWIAAAAVLAAAALICVFAIPAGNASKLAPKALYGNYVFKEQVYMNLLSSFLAYEGYAQYYTLTEDTLTITEEKGLQRSFDITYELSEFDEQEFKDSFVFDLGELDISKYKERLKYTLCAPAEHSEGYELYVIDGELWLAEVNTGELGDRYFWSIYRIEKYGGELPKPAPSLSVTPSAKVESPAMLEDISLELYVGGERVREVTVEDEAGKRVVEDAVMNGMLKSAAWPAVDVHSLEDYIVIRAYYIELQKDKEYVIFDKGGQHCIQFDGMYVILNDGLNDALEELLLGNYKPEIMTVVSGENSIKVTGHIICTQLIYQSYIDYSDRLTPDMVADSIEYLPIEIDPNTDLPFTPFIKDKEVDGEYTIYDMDFKAISRCR